MTEDIPETQITDKQKAGCYLTFIKLIVALVLIGMGIYFFLK